MAASTPTTTVATPSGALAYLKTGSGPALVIVHGIGGHKEDWVTVMDAFAPSRTVYAVDMLGFGGSAKSAPTITVPDQAAAILALLDAEKIEKADLIGNSVGGWVTATFAAAHPDRVGKLVLADAAGFKAMFEGPSPVNFYPDTVADMQKLLQTVRYLPEAQTPAFAETAFANLKTSGDGEAAQRVFAGMFASPKLEEVMPEIKAPTLVLWGMNDKLFPPDLAPYITSLTPGAQSVLVESAGHFPQLDNPGSFIAAARSFLNG